jgi:hypothetical protein
MNQNEKLEKVREFLSREDLEATESKIKENALAVDAKLSAAKADLEQLQNQLNQVNQAANEKNIEVLGLAQQLEGLCGLIISLSDEEEEETTQE